MFALRKILFPIAIIYGLITRIRNYAYDLQIYKSYRAEIPVIAVGNLSVGGTGKTPQIEYLIRLLSQQHKIATLSRGYKRKSKGFVLANATTKMEDIGDEPFQFLSKFKQISVAVDANRVNGITQLLKLTPKPEVILLDDAYQHRKVTADAYILLTAYGDLFTDDYILPMGNLRESRSGANRSTVVVVTKCPALISEVQQKKIQQQIQKYTSSPVFFTTIAYDDFAFSANDTQQITDLQKESCLIVAGIAKPKLFFNFFKKKNSLNDYMTFADHHHFSSKDVDTIITKANGRNIITTEKDYTRLNGLLPENQLYYLPIKAQFLNNEKEFQQIVERVIELKK